MQASDERSLKQLRVEAERDRETLANTVQELRERVGDSATEVKTLISPANIKQEIRQYVRQERDTAVELLQRKVKENPLQVAAVVAAVAYPALGLLRALPAPLWLIGGGLFLTSKRGRAATADVGESLKAAAQKGAEQVADFTGSMTSDLHDRIDDAWRGVDEVRGALTERLEAVSDDAGAKVHDVRDEISGLTDRAASSVKAAVGELVHMSNDGRAAVERVAHAAAPSGVAKLVTDNALLIAGFGAVLGAVLAASIPRSEAENKLFGAGSEKLKGQARKIAESGVQTAGDIVTAAAGDVAQAAAREGLSASGISDAVANVMEGARSVADRGMDTALGNEGRSADSNQSKN